MDNGLLEAKREFTSRFIMWIEPFVIDLFDDIYRLGANDNHPLIVFQERMREVPEWNTHIIRTHVARIRLVCDCLDEMISAIFIAKCKILTSITLSPKDKPNIQLRIPSAETFVHRLFIEYARLCYDDPEIIKFNDRARKRHNLATALDTAISKLLPHKEIMRACLGDYTTGTEFNTYDRNDDNDAGPQVQLARDPSPQPEPQPEDEYEPDPMEQYRVEEPRIINADGQKHETQLHEPFTDTRVADAERHLNEQYVPSQQQQHGFAPALPPIPEDQQHHVNFAELDDDVP